MFGVDTAISLLDDSATTASTRGVGRVPTEADVAHPAQWAAIHGAGQLNAWVLSRQWGKTSSARLITHLGLAKPNSRTIYATLIRRNCKKMFWRPLLDSLKAYGWAVNERDDDGRKMSNDTDFTLYAPNGAFVQALSCNTLADLASIRGDQADDFLVDECQEPNDDVLERLVMQIAMAMIMKRRGRIWLFGTVPDVEPTFYTKCLDDPKWVTFGHSAAKGTPSHSIYENPHIRQEDIDETCSNAGLVPGHPIFEREIMGRRVADPSKVAYEYISPRNDYAPSDYPLGTLDRRGWGLDLGFQDCDAVVVSDRMSDGRIFVPYFWKHNHLDVLALADFLLVLYEVFPPNTITGDHGGHGAVKVMETLSKVLRRRIHSKPGDVMVSVGFVNDDFRTSRLLISTDIGAGTAAMLVAASRMFGREPDRLEAVTGLIVGDPAHPANLGKESTQVAKSVNQRTKKWEINKKGFHSDLTEGLRYAHWGLAHAPAEPEPVRVVLDEASQNALEIQNHLKALNDRAARGRYGRRI